MLSFLHHFKSHHIEETASSISSIFGFFNLFLYRDFMKQDKNKTTPVMKEEIHDTPLDWLDLNNYTPQLCCGWVCRRNF